MNIPCTYCEGKREEIEAVVSVLAFEGKREGDEAQLLVLVLVLGR